MSKLGGIISKYEEMSSSWPRENKMDENKPVLSEPKFIPFPFMRPPPTVAPTIRTIIFGSSKNKFQGRTHAMSYEIGWTVPTDSLLETSSPTDLNQEGNLI